MTISCDILHLLLRTLFSDTLTEASHRANPQRCWRYDHFCYLGDIFEGGAIVISCRSAEPEPSAVMQGLAGS